MIPKKIHYCWFGGGNKPASFERCLESWKQTCPEYEIMEWNEENYLPYQNRFVQDALRKRKYAFAADALRVAVLSSEGGVYLDTDMLLVAPLDSFLNYDFFTGYEVEGRAAYGCFGAIPKHPIIQQMNQFYESHRFDSYSPPVITHTFKAIVNEEQLGANDHIAPPSVFYPLPYEKRGEDHEPYIQDDTVAVHLWDHSWKKREAPGFWGCLHNINSVAVDTVFYGYPTAYWKRYTKEFARKAYHQLIGR